MKLLVFWFLPSFLWALETTQMGTNSPELCEEDEPKVLRYNNSTKQMQPTEENYEDKEEEVEKVSCLFYPEKMLRCTMLGQYLPRGCGLSTSVIIWSGDRTITLPNCSPQRSQPPEEPGEAQLVVECQVDHHILFLTVHLNVSWQGTLTLYCHKFGFELLEVLSPPSNISAEVSKERLLVSWEIPYSRTAIDARCFEYELDDSHEVSTIESVTKLQKPVDPFLGFTVRMRTRKSQTCLGPQEWSTWSGGIDLAKPGYPSSVNYVVIASIVLGLPMIILALLLLLRRHKVSKLLFPPIPQLPNGYQHFLKKPTAFLFLPVVQTAYEEDITIVEDTQSPSDEPKHAK